MTAPLDDRLLEHATDRQGEHLRAVAEHGSLRAAARALGVHHSALVRSLAAVRAKAAMHGYSPDHDLVHPAAPGFKSKGHSTLYDSRTGEPILQWHKTTADQEHQRRLFDAAVNAACETLPRLEPVSAPKHTNADLANLYVITDYHLDMLAWHREGGADWDTKIAEELLKGAFSHMIASCPDADEAIIYQGGDFLHADGQEAVTPTSGHNLDRDTRFEKSVQVAIRSLRAVVDMALRKHARVRFIPAEGNHDIASSVWMRQLFSALYENEPRVNVETSPLPYYAHRFGSTMLAFHHGHLRKMDNLAGIFAAQFPEMWGQTTYRYAHCGHWHHNKVVEANGMIVVQHPTLAAKDAYAARGAYFAERAAHAATYHREFGQVAQITVRPEMLGAA